MIAPFVTCWTSVERFSWVMQAEDEREGEDAEKGPDDGRPAAREAGPADDDGADRVELVEVAADRARRCPAGRTAGTVAMPAQQPREHVDAEDDLSGTGTPAIRAASRLPPTATT